MGDPRDLLGLEVPAADGDDHGFRILDYNDKTEDYIGQAIRWSSGEDLDPFIRAMDRFKLTYRYNLRQARNHQQPKSPT